MPNTPSTPPITPPTAVPTTAPTGPAMRLPSLKPCAAPPGMPCACAASGAAMPARSTPANTVSLITRPFVVHIKRAGLALNEGRKVAWLRQLRDAPEALRQSNAARAHALATVFPMRLAGSSRQGGTMNTFFVMAIIGAAMALAPGAQAAELRVLAGGAMSAVWAELKPKFEQASGHKLDIFFGTTPNLIKEA